MSEHSDRTEQATLGGLIRWPDRVDDVVSFLRAEHFRTDAHQRVYRAIVALREAAKPVEVGSVANELHDRGWLKDIGDYPYLAVLLEQDPTGAGAVHHAKQVRKFAVLRALNTFGKETVEATALGAGSAEELLEEAQRKLLAIAEAGHSGGAVRLDAAVGRYFDLIDARARSGGRRGGLPTGFPDLDLLTGGLNDGEVTILAARTSVGKTTLALQIAGAAAVDDGRATLFVSLEMSESELTHRVLCGASGVDGHRLRNGQPSRDDADRLAQARVRAKGALLFLDDEANQRMTRIAATARRLKRQEGLRLLVLDYIQLVEPEDRKAPRHEQVSQVSRRLKALAKELSIPVLALAQLNRAAEESDQPKLHHLRESGSLEQDSDAVLLMHRSDVEPSVVKINVDKNRNGPTGAVKLVFNKACVRFENYAAGLPPPGGE